MEIYWFLARVALYFRIRKLGERSDSYEETAKKRTRERKVSKKRERPRLLYRNIGDSVGNWKWEIMSPRSSCRALRDGITSILGNGKQARISENDSAGNKKEKFQIECRTLPNIYRLVICHKRKHCFCFLQ